MLADPGDLLGLLQPADSIPASKRNKSLRNAPGREGLNGRRRVWVRHPAASPTAPPPSHQKHFPEELAASGLLEARETTPKATGMRQRELSLPPSRGSGLMMARALPWL